MNNFEILAPVGAEEQLKAAVRCGANAVYLGTGNFNARRNAENFTADTLKNTVDYCHLRNVKVYITLNTLIFDKELTDIYDTIEKIAKSGADAVIVQDFAVANAVKQICPQLPLHASTQMAVHNTSGARLLQEFGFSRVVLARELSLAEIKTIREAVDIELEVFVHGAHCMATSGNCYLSAMLGERSGNRGLCAQGCRLNWVSQHGREYALSLKDMSYLDSIKDLMDIGIESFKIEGRMKRPEYVAAAVTSLKNAIDNKPYNKEALRSVFSRNGFTDGYLKGKRDLTMFGYRGKEDVTSANNVLKSLEQLYKNDIHPTGVDISLTLNDGKPTILQMEAQSKRVSVTGAVGEAPRTAPLSQEIAQRNASKLGDTPFFLQNFAFENPDNLTISASEINLLRRQAATLLQTELTHVDREIYPVTPEKSSSHHPSQQPKIRVRLESFSQYSDAFDSAEFVILPVDEIIKNQKEIEKIKHRIIAELPALIYPHNEENICVILDKIKNLGINRAYCSNIGALKIARDKGFILHGSHGLNITNTDALNTYKDLGLCDATLSFELSEKSLKVLGGDIQRGLYIYGYLPLMLFRSCPQKSFSGCGDCSGKTTLTDRKGIDFPLLCHNKQYSILHNSVPLYIGDKNLSMLDFATLYFTVETKEKCIEIFESFIKKKNITGPKTNGLFMRELL